MRAAQARRQVEYHRQQAAYYERWASGVSIIERVADAAATGLIGRIPGKTAVVDIILDASRGAILNRVGPPVAPPSPG